MGMKSHLVMLFLNRHPEGQICFFKYMNKMSKESKSDYSYIISIMYIKQKSDSSICKEIKKIFGIAIVSKIIQYLNSVSNSRPYLTVLIVFS